MKNDYKNWIIEVKQKIRSSQIKAAFAVNSALIEFYWDLGKMIAEKENIWGGKLIERIAKDLKKEFPDIKGLSKSNLKYCKRFYSFYLDNFTRQSFASINSQPVKELAQQLFKQIGQQLVDQLKNIVRRRIKKIGNK